MNDTTHLGGYDESVFQREVTARFARDGHFNARAMPEMLALLHMIGTDAGVNDVRWAAYMLATVYWETTSLHSEMRQAVDKKGRPLLDKSGRPVLLRRRRWQSTMAPVDEVGHGAGRRYHDPVKVKKLPDGSARITEHDGDQFVVTADGDMRRLTKGARMGSVAGGPTSPVYDADDGTEHAYWGRGYVQLTWWSNYARAGAAIGRGLDLLFDPELVKDPLIAYRLMSHGMRTGRGFANGHRLGHYFHGTHTDYVGARRMVNGQDHASDIAAIARRFEGALSAARHGTAAPAVTLPPLR